MLCAPSGDAVPPQPPVGSSAPRGHPATGGPLAGLGCSLARLCLGAGTAQGSNRCLPHPVVPTLRPPLPANPTRLSPSPGPAARSPGCRPALPAGCECPRKGPGVRGSRGSDCCGRRSPRPRCTHGCPPVPTAIPSPPMAPLTAPPASPCPAHPARPADPCHGGCPSPPRTQVRLRPGFAGGRPARG